MCDAAVSILAGGTTLGGLYSSERARDEQKKAERAKRRIQEKQTQRQKLQQIREGIIGTAQIEQASATQGTSGSSAARGGVGAFQSSVTSNVAFLNQIDALQQNIQRNLEAAGSYQAKAAISSQITSLASGGMFSPTTPNQAQGGGGMATTTVANSGAQMSGNVVGGR